VNRVLIAEVRTDAPCALAGRSVALLGERRFLLRDGSGEIEVAPPPGEDVPLGALVRVEGRLAAAGRFAAEKLLIAGRPALREGESPEWAQPQWARRRGELAARDRLLRALRGWFEGQGFVEVETPVLLPAPGQEPHLLPFATAFHGRDRASPLWLATSPEYAMKRLLAAGFERIFQLGRAFRDGPDEHSPLHAPEFTLLEWYRAWESLGQIGRDVVELLRVAARALRGSTTLERSGRSCDAAAAAVWISVEQAFRELADVELEPYLDGEDSAFLASLPSRLPRVGDSPSEQADSAFFRILIERVEPELGVGRPALLCRYPARHAALATLCADDPRVAERFEAYVLGIELANAFEELRDPDEQERRLRAEQRERVRRGGAPLPISQEFLRALRSGLPPCAGVALGVDRLHLLVTGAARVADLQPFPLEPPAI
jgi:lysyl-tRNA synthetase class 2